MFKFPFSRVGLCASLAAVFFFSGAIANGQQATKKQKKDKETMSSPNDRFLRIRRDGKGRPVAMETSVVRYQTKNADGETVVVDLDRRRPRRAAGILRFTQQAVRAIRIATV